MVCYVCGARDLAQGADPRNPTCAQDLPARDHVISMQRDADTRESLAVCSCGWRNNAPWALRFEEQERAIRAHWLAQRVEVWA